MPLEFEWSFRKTCRPDDTLHVPYRGHLKSLVLRQSEDLSCRRKPASIFACAARLKKTWIPAFAGMTEGRRHFQSTNSAPIGLEPRFPQFSELCALAPLREIFRLLCSRSLRSLHCYPLTFARRAQTFGNLTAEARRTPSKDFLVQVYSELCELRVSAVRSFLLWLRPCCAKFFAANSPARKDSHEA